MPTELRQAVRSSFRRPAFSTAIVLTVALAVAATTLVFAVVDGVLLAPLPYEDPDRLVAIWERGPMQDGDDPRSAVSPANFLTWQDELRSFDGMASLVAGSATLLGEGEPERVGTMEASASYFEIVGARALVGRLYSEVEDVGNGPAVVVLSEAYWRRRFGADSSVVGRTLTVGTTPTTVLGVLPRRFDFEPTLSFSGVGSRDVWLPPQWGSTAQRMGGRWLQVLARLAPGATLTAARQETSALAARLADAFPDRQRGWGVNIVPLHHDLVGDVRETVLIVFGAVCLVLLVACANVANLLMTRATERRHEMAVRAALGAGRGRLVRQLLLESLTLAVAGGAIGVLVAWWGVRWLITAAPDIPRIDAIGIRAPVIGFALLATIATALVFGITPALHIARADAARWLKARGMTGRRGAQRIRATLVVAQVALSLVLLIGAGLLVRSLANRLAVGVGFDVEHLLTVELQLPRERYDSQEQRSRFFERLVERTGEIHGAHGASAITYPPLAGTGSRSNFWPLDRAVPGLDQEPSADFRWVHHGYHAVMGVPLIAGRYFDARDRADAPLAVLINESGARQVWPNENAVGKRIAIQGWPPSGDTMRAEVVGVVGDVRHEGPDTEPFPTIYWNHRQFQPSNQMTLVIRTERGAAEIVPSLRAALRELDPELPLYNIRTMGELYANALARARFTTASLGFFALAALILAAIGVYGVMAYATEQRSREIGVRLALGASPASVAGMVVRQGMVHVGAAVILGAASAFALARLLQSLVFEVSTADPATFLAMAMLLGITGLIACWLPARRASRIDPVEAIRTE